MERFKLQDNRNGTFSVLDDRTGKLVFENETYTIADNVCFRLNHSTHPYLDGHPNECDEIAEAIAKRLEQKEVGVRCPPFICPTIWDSFFCFLS